MSFCDKDFFSSGFFVGVIVVIEFTVGETAIVSSASVVGSTVDSIVGSTVGVGVSVAVGLGVGVEEVESSGTKIPGLNLIIFGVGVGVLVGNEGKAIVGKLHQSAIASLTTKNEKAISKKTITFLIA